jgi:hypothetical protein
MLIIIAGALGVGLVWGWVSGLWLVVGGASWRTLAACFIIAFSLVLELYFISGLWYMPQFFFLAFLIALFFHMVWRRALRRGSVATDHFL